MRDRYQNDQKQGKGRIPIWRTLLLGYRGGDALLFPEKTRKELDVVLVSGVQPEHIYAVDKSAAVIATFTRTLSAPERAAIHRRGAMASDACSEWAKEGVRLEVAHFDFCANVEGYFDGSVRQELETIARSGIINNARIAVTILKGRETRNTTKKFKRISLLKAALENGFRGRSVVTEIDSDEYQNGPSPMQWIVFQTEETQ
jgi:hypothetical protein